ncbi:MAG: hypothetical protein PHC75_02295 [Burkholderiales bacterium]|nr:hypothetical protein [Burkholderiales bacterium]
MKKLKPFLFIIIAVFLYTVYFYANRMYDRHIGNNAYNQMIVMDQELTKLQQETNELHHEKSTNTAIIQEFNTLNKTNFDSRKVNFSKLISQLNYESEIESSLMAITMSTNNANFKSNRDKLKIQLRLLKYNYNKKVAVFNSKIDSITNEVKDLTADVSKIGSDSLQNLELARLKFISHKISRTVVDLNGSLVDKIIDDVIEKDRISDKDSDGN